jgi:hypothetical protein
MGVLPEILDAVQIVLKKKWSRTTAETEALTCAGARYPDRATQGLSECGLPCQAQTTKRP